jgi:guanylate kinase
MLSISTTTRHPRPGEAEERDYRFVSDEEFDRLVRRGAFLEWADVFGHRYGTLAAPIREALTEGRDTILEIDVQGASKIREEGLPATFVFLVPPSEAELALRLRKRDTESDAEVARRLAGADEEMQAAAWFDHVVVNDDVDRAAAELAAIIAGTPQEPPGASRPTIPPADPTSNRADGEEKETDP